MKTTNEDLKCPICSLTLRIKILYDIYTCNNCRNENLGIRLNLYVKKYSINSTDYYYTVQSYINDNTVIYWDLDTNMMPMNSMDLYHNYNRMHSITINKENFNVVRKKINGLLLLL